MPGRQRHPLVSFLPLVTVQLVGYLILRAWFPLEPHLQDVPLADINRLAPTLGEGLLYALLLCLLYAAYLLAYRLVMNEHLPAGLARPAVILGIAAVYAVVLLGTFPFNATDLYRYVIRGRVQGVYFDNPYTTPPDAFASDPYLPLAGEWAGETSPYGPFWETLAGAAAEQLPAASEVNLWHLLLFFKGVAILAHLATGWLIWTMQRELPAPHRLGRTLLWAWNPALLLIFAVDGHNDALMLFWLAVGLWLLLTKRHQLSLLAVTAAVLTKPIALLALPFFALAAWRERKTWRDRTRLVALAIPANLLLAWLAFIPYGNPFPLARRLMLEASSVAGFSPATLVILIGQRANVHNIYAIISQASILVFVGIALLIFGLVWARKRPLLRSIGQVFAAYVYSALSFRLWYASWVGLWLVTDNSSGSRYWRHAALWFLLTSQLSVVIYGHALRNLLNGDHLFSHLIGVPVTFGLPLVLARFSSSKRSREIFH
jgi:hypothetical protein